MAGFLRGEGGWISEVKNLRFSKWVGDSKGARVELFIGSRAERAWGRKDWDCWVTETEVNSTTRAVSSVFILGSSIARQSDLVGLLLCLIENHPQGRDRGYNRIWVRRVNGQPVFSSLENSRKCRQFQFPACYPFSRQIRRLGAALKSRRRVIGTGGKRRKFETSKAFPRPGAMRRDLISRRRRFQVSASRQVSFIQIFN